VILPSHAAALHSNDSQDTADSSVLLNDVNRDLAVIDALTAHIAVIDREANIVLVNQRWRAFGQANGLQISNSALGVNYLRMCEKTSGVDAADARAVCEGIRKVLARESKKFAHEYSCHSATEQRWFRVVVTPLHNSDIGAAVVSHVNITDRKKVEVALRRTEELYRRAIRGAGAVPYASDFITRTYIFMGEGIQDLIGYSPAEVNGALWNNIIQESVMHGQAAGLTKQEAAKRVLNGQLQQWRCDMRVITKSGESRWISDASVQNLDETGKPISAMGILQDITERKRLAAQLELERIRLETAQQIARIGCWEMDLSAETFSWTEQTHRIFETDAAAFTVTYENMLRLVHPEDRQKLDVTFTDSLASADPSHLEHRLRLPDGRIKFVEARWQVFFDNDRKPARVIGTCLDITDRKQAAEKLAEQAELLDKAQDAILVRDLNDRVTYWNQSAERLYGWKSEEIVGKRITKLIYHDAAPYQRAMQQLLANGEWIGELDHLTKDGRRVSIEGRWTLVRDSLGEPKAVLSINTDVTERKRIEAQFLRAQRMDSIGTLAGGIAHDLNNVLAPIMMSLAILKQEVRSPQAARLLATLESSAQRGADLVQQVLSFARGMDGKRIPVNMLYIARDVRKIINDTFPKNITFTLEAAKDLWSVNGDATQLHQVIMNLCVNARDAMQNGGRLETVLENASIDEVYSKMNPDAHPGHYVRLKVIDTGTGMAPNVLEKVFEPFFTTKEVGKGTGLGLSTVLGIVKSHGGFIRVYSEVGRGSRFEVNLPKLAGVGASEKQPTDRQLPRGNGESILVVDDEEAIRLAAKETLEQFGYSALLAANGAEAVAMFVQHQHDIDLVLTDMAMPIMDGAALISALRSLNPQARILASSGLANQNKADSVRFIPKPYNAEELLAAINESLAVQQN
jgi:PAS domain S-box-containing protein